MPFFRPKLQKVGSYSLPEDSYKKALIHWINDNPSVKKDFEWWLEIQLEVSNQKLSKANRETGPFVY